MTISHYLDREKHFSVCVTQAFKVHSHVACVQLNFDFNTGILCHLEFSCMKEDKKERKREKKAGKEKKKHVFWHNSTSIPCVRVDGDEKYLFICYTIVLPQGKRPLLAAAISSPFLFFFSC